MPKRDVLRVCTCAGDGRFLNPRAPEIPDPAGEAQATPEMPLAHDAAHG